VIYGPCFDGKSATESQQYLKQSVGKGLAQFREQISSYGKTNVALV